MRRKMIWLLFIVLGIGVGTSFAPSLWFALGQQSNRILMNAVFNAALGMILFIILAVILINPLEKFIQRLEQQLLNQRPDGLFSIVVSVIFSLLIATLIASMFSHSRLFLFNTVVPIALLIFFGYLGYFVGRSGMFNLKNIANLLKRRADKEKQLNHTTKTANFSQYKLLDTNILIDGRIYDLVKTGFIEGTLVVPNFVLYELQYIADSGDSIKRVRGRRGLDILNKLKSEKGVFIKMDATDFDDIKEVDSKLIALAKKLHAVIVTNDYNLNKVSEFQQVQVLNVNALAKALRPRVIPGETLKVLIIKNGTERQQGVAYLDDGTMIVVEDGRNYLNKTIEVEVTSAIQTDAGRMIFAKPVYKPRRYH